MLALLLLSALPFTDQAGVQVHCAENLRGKVGRARVDVVIGAGALHEPEGSEGVAHLLEHLVLRPLGFDDNNGATNWDHTNYFTETTADELEAKTIELLEAVRKPTLTEQDIEIERKVVNRELSERGDASRSELSQTLFRDTIFDRPLGGTTADVDGLDLAKVTAFHDANYRRGNMALLILGAVSCEPLLEKLRPILESFPEGGPSKRPIETTAPRGPRTLPRTGGTFIGGVFAYDATPEERVELAVIAKHLEQRAFKDLRAERGITYSPESIHHLMSTGGLAAVRIKTDSADSDVEEWFHQTMTELHTSKTPRELTEKAITEVKKSMTTRGLEEALARIHGEPSPIEILETLDETNAQPIIEKITAKNRQFYTSSPGSATNVVLGVAGLVVLAGFGLLMKKLWS